MLNCPVMTKSKISQGSFTDFNVWDSFLPETDMEEFTLCRSKPSLFSCCILILAYIFDMETNASINISRSNIAGNLLPWDGNDWERSSEILEEEYKVHQTIG